MPLSPASRLGAYEIVSAIGSGGMGEVYRARDAKLGRDVAIKVLPQALSDDPERLARFDREARTLAALSHHNIAHIYGFEDSTGTPALVMELVEGPTLADRIAKGPIPFDEAVPIARQIAEGLEAAHEQGIIHRDLKPANIKVRDDGSVKILDFGLAKALEPKQPSGTNVTQSPTITTPAMMTGIGVILGTAAYMSPEQAKGRPADKRSDVWAFGCVLYEMLTGKRAFAGDDVSDTLASVLKTEPDWTALPADTPRSIRTFLRHALEKDRYHRIGDIAAALFALVEAVLTDGVAATPTRRPSRVLSAISAVVAAMAVLVAILTWISVRGAADLQPFQFSIQPPDGWTLGANGASVLPIAVSPDGHRLVFEARSGERSQLWLRSFDSVTPRALPGTDNGERPFWSPDSRFVAFFADGKLKKIAISGGPPVTVCDAGLGAGAWSPGGTIVFSQGLAGGSLRQVPASGGVPTAATVLQPGETSHGGRPQFLPDGRHFLYGGGLPRDGLAIRPTYVGSLEKNEPARLVGREWSSVAYADGHILFSRDATLLAQPFDPDRLAFSGEAFPVADGLIVLGSARIAAFSTAPHGVVAYATGRSLASKLVVMDRGGKTIGQLPDADNYREVAISPDGTRAAVRVQDAQRLGDIWIVDLIRGVRMRLTANRNAGLPIWSADGRTVAFMADGGREIVVQSLVESTTNDVLLQDDLFKGPASWSPDRRFMAVSMEMSQRRRQELWIVPVDAAERKPYRFASAAGAFRDGPPLDAAFSPDGRWLAYDSAESGRDEVYVAPFPGPGLRTIVSTRGGVRPRWRRDGREIVYRSVDNNVMAVPVSVSNGTLEIGQARELFALPPSEGYRTYDVTPDGQKFLVGLGDAGSRTVIVMINWLEQLKARVPTK